MTTADSRGLVRKLAPADVPRVAELLAGAFDDDPAYGHVFPDRARRPLGLADLFARNLQTHLPYACTHVLVEGAHVVATVTVRPPGGVHISLFTMVRRGLLPFALANGTSAVKRLFRVKEIYDEIERQLGGGRPYWHVHMMAVDPARKGEGLGSRLLADVLALTADAPRAPRFPTILTTHTERNTVFYRRAGFDLTEKRVLAPPRVDAPYDVWCMRRG